MVDTKSVHYCLISIPLCAEVVLDRASQTCHHPSLLFFKSNDCPVSKVDLYVNIEMVPVLAEQRRWFDHKTSKVKSRTPEQHVSMSHSANSSLTSQPLSRVSDDYSDDGLPDVHQDSESDR